MKYNCNKHPLTDDDRLLAARARELAERAGYSAVVSDFLSPREQIVFFESAAAAGMAQSCFFWGGCLLAERRAAVILPDWMLSGENDTASVFSAENEAFICSLIESGGDSGEIQNSIKLIRLKGSGYSSLTHRDWLGAILSLGIKRDVVGDISVFSDSEAAVFVSSKIADYIADTLTHVKNDTVSASVDESGTIIESPRTFRHYETIVQSLRLDGVVKALVNISRADAADLVRSGKIDLNYFTETDVDAEIAPGDIISIHGFGKYIIDRVEGHTKSGKLKLKSRKYI